MECCFWQLVSDVILAVVNFYTPLLDFIPKKLHVSIWCHDNIVSMVHGLFGSLLTGMDQENLYVVRH